MIRVMALASGGDVGATWAAITRGHGRAEAARVIATGGPTLSAQAARRLGATVTLAEGVFGHGSGVTSRARLER